MLVLSHDGFNERSGTVIVVAITSEPPRAGYPLTVELASGRLPKRSWVKVSQVRTISTARLGKKLGRVSAQEIERVVAGLNEIIAA